MLMNGRQNGGLPLGNPQVYDCYRTDEPIIVDGLLNEGIWKKSPPIPYFGDLTTGGAPFFSTNAKMVWDDEFLYVAYAFQDPHIWAYNTIRDVPMCNQRIGLVSCLEEAAIPLKGGWGDAEHFTQTYTECFAKCYLDPDGDGLNYVEIHVNPRNNICDKWMEASWHEDARVRCGLPADQQPNSHVEWNCPGIKTAVHLDGTLNDPYDLDNGWTIEMAIPFTSLRPLAKGVAFPPENGDRWRVHLGRRYRPHDKAEDVYYWTWPVLNEVSCHYPDKWGEIIFRNEIPKSMPDTDLSSFKRPSTIFFPKSACEPKDLPKSAFDWKAIWMSMHPGDSNTDPDLLVNGIRNMGFNVLLLDAESAVNRFSVNGIASEPEGNRSVDLFAAIVERARFKGLQVFAWINFLSKSRSGTVPVAHPGHCQRVRSEEEERTFLPRSNPERENVHDGSWLCPDQGLSSVDRTLTEDILNKYPVDGIAIDNLGYRNYYACFCDFSNHARSAYALKHPDLSEKELLTRFSENSLIRFTEQLRQMVQSINPDLKLVIHVYPDFDLNPDYGNKLHVDYCGQAISGMYLPYSSLGKVQERVEEYKRREKSFLEFNEFVPFIGMNEGSLRKDPERIRAEMRIAGSAGSKSIMLASYASLVGDRGLGEVVAEEFNSTS
jgi:hypothetical protein